MTAAPEPGLPPTADEGHGAAGRAAGWLRGRGGAPGAVVAYGGAGLSAGADALTAVEAALLHGAAPAGRPPYVCLVPTASGDGDELMDRFRALVEEAGGEPHVLSLFRRTEAPFGNVLDSADLVYVTGGAVANLAALWRLHGLDAELEQAWRRGVVLAGSSAGGLIWSSGGVTTSFGEPAGWHDGLGLLPGSLCPHFDTQPERAELYRGLVAAGDLLPGYGLDEHAAAVFRDGRLEAVLADEPGARVHEVGGAPGR